MRSRMKPFDDISSRSGPGEGTQHLHHFARLRGAVLSTALLGALLLAAHPNWVSTAMSLVIPSKQPASPTFPAEMLIRSAEATYLKGDYEQSNRYYELLCLQHPDHTALENAVLQQVRGLVQLKEHSQAAEKLEELRALFPRNKNLPALFLQQAEWQYAKEEFTEAAHSYTNLVSFMTLPRRVTISEDTAPPARTQRRRLLAEAKRIAKRNEIERLARFNSALSFEASGNDRGAERAYSRFVIRFPLDSRTVETHFRMGAIHLRQGGLHQAVHHFGKVYRSDESRPELRLPAIYYAGRCLEKLNQPLKAIVAYEQAESDDTTKDKYWLEAMHRLSYLLEKEHPERAAEIYRKLAQHNQSAVGKAMALEKLAMLHPGSELAAVER